jgi:phosphatidylinositol alpha-1,6-mannosyltransferase
MASGTPALGLDVAGARDALANGELGTGVSDSWVGAALARALDCPKRDPHTLSDAVRARFGWRNFTTAARSAVERVLAPS